jgi:hypothetical protein
LLQLKISKPSITSGGSKDGDEEEKCGEGRHHDDLINDCVYWSMKLCESLREEGIITHDRFAVNAHHSTEILLILLGFWLNAMMNYLRSACKKIGVLCSPKF